MRNKVLTRDPHPQSRASLIELQRYFRNQSVAGYQIWLTFRQWLLRKWEEDRIFLQCEYCGKRPLKIDTDNNDPFVATLDHVVPRSKGGKEFDPDNLVVSCYRCNQKKGSKSIMEDDPERPRALF